MDIYVTRMTVGPIAPAATIAIPHTLHVDGVRVRPSMILPDRATQIVVQSADTAEVIFRNDGGSAATALFDVKWIHSVDSRQTPDFYWLGIDAGVDMVMGFVFRPGGVQDGNVYNNWPDLYVALIGVEGLRQVLFDDTIAAVTIPAGTYDMQGVRWMGEAEYGALGPAGVVQINIAEGCILQNLRDFYGPMLVNNEAFATIPCQDLADDGLVVLRGGVILNSATGIPIYRTTGMGAGEECAFFLDQSAQIGGVDVGNVIDIDNVGTTVYFQLGSMARIHDEALNNPIGSTFAFEYRSTDSQVDLYQPDALGTITETSHEKHRYEVPAVKTANYNAELNETVRCDAVGGTFVITLPPIATTVLATPIRTYGGTIIVKEEDGTNLVTVDGTAADTIDGGAGAVTVPPGGSLVFVSDGISDWKTVAINRETLLHQANTFTDTQTINYDGNGNALAIALATDLGNQGIAFSEDNVIRTSAYLRIVRAANATGPVIDITPGGSAAALRVRGGAIDLSIAGDGGERVVSDTDDHLNFYTAGVERMRVTATTIACYEELYIDDNFRITDGHNLVIGSSVSDSRFRHSTAQTVDSLLLGVGTESRAIIVVEAADLDYNFAHPQQTNPTLFIQSANQSATEWLSLAHNQTNGVIGVGTATGLSVEITGVEALRVEDEATLGAAETSLWLYDDDNGQMEQVTVGAAGSGGAGKKLLCIPN